MKNPSFTFHPDHLSGSSPWLEHLPFAYDLVKALAPKLIVELSTCEGDSFFTMCQSVATHQLKTLCYAVDQREHSSSTTNGAKDQRVRSVFLQNYSKFAYQIKTNLKNAEDQFQPNSIDLLHLDDCYGYHELNQSFEAWIDKVKEGGVILIHDICARGDQSDSSYEGWKFWAEISSRYPSWSFHHGGGLGILLKGANEDLAQWLDHAVDQTWADYYVSRGHDLSKIGKTIELQKHLEEQKLEIINLQRYRSNFHSLENKQRELEIRLKEKDAIIKELEVLTQQLEKQLQEIPGRKTELHLQETDRRLLQTEKLLEDAQLTIDELSSNLEGKSTQLDQVRAKLKTLEASNSAEKNEKERLLRLKRAELEIFTNKLKNLFAKAKEKEILNKQLKSELKEAIASKKKMKQAVQQWNSRSWFTRAFHRLRLKD